MESGREGQSHERYVGENFVVHTAPTGLTGVFGSIPHPTLKRGANKHCAYGADNLFTLASAVMEARG
jgi:hypothetical protein